ncbi:MAG: MipA/OmpV family protein [Alphaproteobacteria bacterium]
MKHTPFSLLLLFSMTFFAFPQEAQSAEMQPQKESWKIGMSAWELFMPDYPASEEHKTRILVLPYLEYHSAIFHSDEKGLLRGEFIQEDWVNIEFSAKGSLPSDSSENYARRGMPDLDWLGEIGPKLTFNLISPRREDDLNLDFNIPLRAAFSTNFRGGSFRGFLSDPGFFIERKKIDGHTTLQISLTSTFATEKLMDYFYEVDTPYVIDNDPIPQDNRPAYNAKEGYLGSQLLMRLSSITGGIENVAYISLHDFNSAKNNDSPLFKKRFNAMIGYGIVIPFASSK